jgi:hypothetical protein
LSRANWLISLFWTRILPEFRREKSGTLKLFERLSGEKPFLRTAAFSHYLDNRLFYCNMTRFRYFFFLLLLLAVRPVAAQTIREGVSYETWDRMGKRWKSYMGWVEIELKNGQKAEGQLTSVTENAIVVQTNSKIPVFPIDVSQVDTLDFSRINMIRLKQPGHPYQGMILGAMAGAVPGAVTGLILAQGWTVIPAIVFGTVTAAGGGLTGHLIQKAARREQVDLNNMPISQKSLRMLEKSALFRDSFPGGLISENPEKLDIKGFETHIQSSPWLQKAFPDNRWSLTVQTGLMTNNIRKKLQTWFLEPFWGPPQSYFETRIVLQADITRRLGRRFLAGALLNMAPGDISSAHFSRYDNQLGVYYGYTHIFEQTVFAFYGGYLIQPSDRFLSHRLQGSIQAGLAASDIYEHFYYNWNTLDYQHQGDKLTQVHFWRPGGFIRLRADYYLIPGLSLNLSGQVFVIKPVRFENREILPETIYGPQYIPMHKLNFTNIQVNAGFAWHF